MLVQRSAMLVGNLPRPTLSASWGATPFAPCDGGGEFYITFSVTNPVGNEYVDVQWSTTGTYTNSDTSGHFTSSPITIATPLCSAPTGSYTINATVRLYTSLGVLLDTVTLPEATG